ncbi:hypothetical protein BH11MYX1_BH11MYX1_35010 [soil metagenome]
MAEDKKTQLGQTPSRTNRPTGGPQPVEPTGVTDPGLAAAPVAKGKTSYMPPSDDPLVGSELAGRYTIGKKLGEGGMGAVYLATHMILEKQVALKVLHGEFARKPDLVERFMQEAKAASRIRHENVIDISDFGATPEGFVFFAMELLQGHDLHDEIARARVAGNLLPWSRTKKIFLQICSALTAAHAKGIVHRDLKPENIYLVEFLGDPDFVKLLDFGIAKLTDAADEGGRKLTKTGMLFGTPEYMSPEQARGEQVDHRVDVYAMGCILFQLVTNRVPFEAENFMGVLSMHLTEPPPSISPAVFEQIGAPQALAGVIDRALDKDRGKRWQTIEELANAVREVCGDPIPTGIATVRAANVSSPSQTTQRRAQTPTSAGGTPAAIVPEGTGRVKTQWTGALNVPVGPVEDAKQATSKLPLIVGAVLLIGGAIAAAVVVMGSKQSPATTDGRAGSAVALQPLPAPTPPPGPTPVPTPVLAPTLPEMVKLTLDTTPHGATVTDLSTNRAFPGKTPITTSLPGQKGTRQFSVALKGYQTEIVELPLDKETVSFTEPLTRGAAGTPVVHHVLDATLKPTPPTGSDSGAVTKPDPGEPVTKPDPGTKPDPTKPDPNATKPPKSDDPKCDDPNVPCWKTPFPAGGGQAPAGSGS